MLKTEMEETYTKFKEFSQSNKLPILSLVFSATLFSIHRTIKGTKDFGLQKLQSQASLRNNQKHIAWIFAYRTLVGTFSAIGFSYCTIGLIFQKGFGINSGTEFQAALSNKFPNLKSRMLDEEDVATTDFLKEVLIALEEEEDYKESEINKMIGESVRKELGPFSKRIA